MAVFPVRGERSRSRTPGLLAAAIAAAILATGCAGSGYSYHSNQAENLFFKVPDDWTVFDTRDFLEGEELDGLWVRGFAGGAKPSVDTVFALTSEEPRGFVEVMQLNRSQRDALSIDMLRRTNFLTDANGSTIDPLELAEARPDVVSILGYDSGVVFDAGPHGVHIRYALTRPGETTAVVDQTVLVDSATTRRYVLNIGCNLDCFEDHEHEIQEVIESWTLEAT